MKNVIPFGRAICYSGYREGQSPKTAVPSLEEIRQDLMILVDEGYQYLRLYDPNLHAERVLQLITEEALPLKCIVGIDSDPEENNANCPFETQDLSEQQLRQNIARNDGEVEKLIALVRKYGDAVLAVSVGNENTPFWGAHRVSEERLIGHARRLKQATDKPVTFCEGYFEWKDLAKLAAELDFISIHTYPYHYGTPIGEAVALNREQYHDIQRMYPDKQVIITELGWSSDSTAKSYWAVIRNEFKEIAYAPGEPPRASVKNAGFYLKEVERWVEQEQVTAFYFEAFDELWKGDSPRSSECNFGVYNNDRVRKYPR